MDLNEQIVIEWLEEVKDPEIPVISLIDLGVITEISIEKGNKVRVEMTPTFAGCPAIDYMRKDVERTLAAKGLDDFEVNVSFKSQWSSNNISTKGKAALKNFGLAPPPHITAVVDLNILEHTPCPFCDSTDTELKSPFGPTLCRALHYCHHCHQAFEQFKPV